MLNTNLRAMIKEAGKRKQPTPRIIIVRIGEGKGRKISPQPDILKFYCSFENKTQDTTNKPLEKMTTEERIAWLKEFILSSGNLLFEHNLVRLIKKSLTLIKFKPTKIPEDISYPSPVDYNYTRMIEGHIGKNTTPTSLLFRIVGGKKIINRYARDALCLDNAEVSKEKDIYRWEI